MFEQYFIEPTYYEYLDKIYNLNNVDNEDIYRRYISEVYNYRIIDELKLYNLGNLTWSILLVSIYDSKLVTVNKKNPNNVTIDSKIIN